MTTLEQFAKKVSFHETVCYETGDIHLTTTFKLKRIDRITERAIKQTDFPVLKDVKENAVRILFHEIYGDRRQTFYRLLERVRFECNMPSPKFNDAIKALSTLFD